MRDWLGVDVSAVRRYGIGDLLAIGIFVVIGEISHGIEPIGQPIWVLETFIPFFLGWVIAGPILGAYSTRSLQGPIWAAIMVLPAWLVGDGIGQLLRDTAVFHGSGHPVFYAVAAGVGGIALIGWRLVVHLGPRVFRVLR